MGNIVLRNRILESMNNLEHGDDGGDDSDHFEVARDRLFNGMQDDEDDTPGSRSEFASILRHLIRSGEIMVLNYESYTHHPLPVIRKKPNLQKLMRNDIYHSTQIACGQSDTVGVGEDGGGGGGHEKSTAPFSLMSMVADRQQGLGKRKGPFMQSDKCKIINHFRPNSCTETISSCDSKVFCGRFTSNGDQFVTAGQDALVRVYDSSRCQYKLKSTLETKHVAWSILDIDFSPDGSSFVYSTWADALFISRLERGMSDSIHSLYLCSNNRKLGVFTVCYSSCGKHILCGANDGSLYAYDLAANRRTLMAPVAREETDVNTVGFVDELSNIFFSGSDDSVIKLWDRRCMNESNPEAVGRLIGHYDGITYIDSRNDGRYIISNSKDQSIKLWDLRKMSPSNIRREQVLNHWDYRWDDVPKRFFNITKSLRGDTSIMTYRGHKVQKSLIRAKFSPASTTGQRYIYTGCGTGRLIIYDVLTGSIVEAIEGHHDIVRDVDWHPHRTEVMTCSWDGTVHRHTHCSSIEKQEQRERLHQLKSRRLSNANRSAETASDADEDDEEEFVDRIDGIVRSPPVRRSRRLAERYSHDGGRATASGRLSTISSSSSASVSSNSSSSASSSSSSSSNSVRSSSSGRISRNGNFPASRTLRSLRSFESSFRSLRRRLRDNP
ncbi:DDB1- and CUL4-associated factor 11 [Anopheles maculipalpis]|uniref:DDB1- and CUL4-associated factor 11 n=1 Tax=Anopheles maculipalpis TaxID=1496333 RepID=UPI00215959AF|nr:DDB1- and CUL4-associated factor 11 [Anopheles maculipalpis]